MIFTSRSPSRKLIGLVFCFTFFMAEKAWSAACCARSAAAPFLILTDDHAQVNLGVSAADAVAHVADELSLRAPGTTDLTQQYRLDGATLISDRWQAGASVAMVGRSVGSQDSPETSLGLGDTRLSFGYEFLPNWNYSSWKPQGRAQGLHHHPL